MSEELKKKLYNYEASPPGKTWEEIANILKDEINNEFIQKLYRIEVNPPAGTWKKIATAIESNVREEYPAKLFNLEIVPPPQTWEKISSVLAEENTPSQISATRKIIPLVRYAVAACFIGIVAFGAWKLLNPKKIKNAVAVKNVLPEKNPSKTVRPENQNNSPGQTLSPLSNNLPKESTLLVKENRVSKKRDPLVQTGYMTQTAALSPSMPGSSLPNFQQASLKGEVPGNCSLISEADRYLNFMNPDGYLIRISKKLAEALGCYLNGNSDNNQCQEQMKKWRNKLAQSRSASPDNFMDILNIIRSVQDN